MTGVGDEDEAVGQEADDRLDDHERRGQPEHNDEPRPIPHTRAGVGLPALNHSVSVSVKLARRKFTRFQMSSSENSSANAGIAVPG